MDYSKVVKLLRKELLVSQMELAKILNVSYQTVNRWENGKTVPVYKDRRQLRELCIKYNIPIEEGEYNGD